MSSLSFSLPLVLKNHFGAVKPNQQNLATTVVRDEQDVSDGSWIVCSPQKLEDVVLTSFESEDEPSIDEKLVNAVVADPNLCDSQPKNSVHQKIIKFLSDKITMSNADLAKELNTHFKYLPQTHLKQQNTVTKIFAGGSSLKEKKLGVQRNRTEVFVGYLSQQVEQKNFYKDGPGVLRKRIGKETHYIFGEFYGGKFKVHQKILGLPQSLIHITSCKENFFTDDLSMHHEGEGTIKYQTDGSAYAGEIKNNAPVANSEGTLTLQNGMVFKGHVSLQGEIIPGIIEITGPNATWSFKGKCELQEEGGTKQYKGIRTIGEEVIEGTFHIKETALVLVSFAGVDNLLVNYKA